MPTASSSLMTPDAVNNNIVNFLQKAGFSIKKGISHSEVDIWAKKDEFELIIESRGN
ncbi:hypothetical protein [Peribacillus sp. Hz7]|uniref:hypothetical protein n=1 Tax=Peribacillus sp. Hz7 TaxID=3344873 RepID=UPI0035CC6903